MLSIEERTAGRGNLRSKVAGVVPAYTLEAVRWPCLLDAVVVNTEDQGISGIATVCNRQVIHRPMSLVGAWRKPQILSDLTWEHFEKSMDMWRFSNRRPLFVP